MIRTVIFSLKGSNATAHTESLTKQFDEFLYTNKITRESIITIQYSVAGGGAFYVEGHNIMLVYEMEDDQPTQ